MADLKLTCRHCGNSLLHKREDGSYAFRQKIVVLEKGAAKAVCRECGQESDASAVLRAVLLAESKN